MNIDARNQLWSKRHCGNKTTTLFSCIGLMKEQRVYFIRIYLEMRWKLLSCWSCKEIRLYLQHLTEWIAQFLDENRIHFNLQRRTLFQLVIQLSILFRISWMYHCITTKNLRGVVHWSSTIHNLCTPSRIVHLQLTISNGTYPDPWLFNNYWKRLLWYPIQSGVSFTKFLYTFQSDVERLKRQEVNNCQV